MSEEEASGGTQDGGLELKWLELEHKARELERERECQLRMKELEIREKEMECEDGSRIEGERTWEEFKEKELLKDKRNGS